MEFLCDCFLPNSTNFEKKEFPRNFHVFRIPPNRARLLFMLEFSLTFVSVLQRAFLLLLQVTPDTLGHVVVVVADLAAARAGQKDPLGLLYLVFGLKTSPERPLEPIVYHFLTMTPHPSHEILDPKMGFQPRKFSAALLRRTEKVLTSVQFTVISSYYTERNPVHKFRKLQNSKFLLHSSALSGSPLLGCTARI